MVKIDMEEARAFNAFFISGFTEKIFFQESQPPETYVKVCSKEELL